MEETRRIRTIHARQREKAMHPSILSEEASLEHITLPPSEFRCPLCPKFKTKNESAIQRHMKNHKENAVHFHEKIICRCNMPCRDKGHFHCPFCSTTVIRKDFISPHVTECFKKCVAVVPLLHQSSPSSSEDLIVQSLDHSYALLPSVSAPPTTTKPPEEAVKQELPSSHLSHPLSQTASPKTPTLVIDQSPPATTIKPSEEVVKQELPSSHLSYPLSQTASPKTPTLVIDQLPPATTIKLPEEVVKQELPSSHLSYPLFQTASPKTPTLVTDQSPPATTTEPLEPPLRSSHVKCPHCTIVLYKKNLALHIQRQHSQQKNVTAKSHLKSIRVAQNNGVYAVRKITKGFSVPVHVLRKTWGQQHVTKCEVEDCRQYHLLAQRSDLSHSLCHHIRSVDNCSTTANEELLQHQVLSEMVENKFCGDSKVDLCKKNQKEAAEAHVPLSALVELGGSPCKICCVHGFQLI